MNRGGSNGGPGLIEPVILEDLDEDLGEII